MTPGELQRLVVIDSDVPSTSGATDDSAERVQHAEHDHATTAANV